LLLFTTAARHCQPDIVMLLLDTVSQQCHACVGCHRAIIVSQEALLFLFIIIELSNDVITDLLIYFLLMSAVG